MLVALGIPACAPDSGTLSKLNGETMGTTWSVQFVAPSGKSSIDTTRAIQSELDLVVTQMSTWAPESDISRYNQADPDTWLELPDEIFVVLEYALSLASETGGAYDPTVGPLVNLWGFGPDGERRMPPSDQEIPRARARVGWSRVRTDRAARRVLQPGGTYLDLSSIAKGYAVDRVAWRLDALAIENYLVEVGGELRARGRKPGGQSWRVAIEKPEANANGVSEIIELGNLSVATSGDYRINFEYDGRRYSHTIDPRTARPIDHSLVSVTVVHQDCMHADALATALTVLGPIDGLAFAREHDLAVLFIERAASGFREKTTPAFDKAIVHR